MSSKNLAVFEKSLDLLLKPPFSENVFKKPRNFYKSLTLSLKMSSKSLKIVQNASHYWKKPPLLFKKASDFLKSLSSP
jgi:hypothetical protein